MNIYYLFCFVHLYFFFHLLREEMKRWISGGGEERDDKTVFPIQSALLFLFPAWFKVFVTWAPGDDIRIYQFGMWQRVEFKAAAISLPFLQLMTSDRSATGGAGGGQSRLSCKRYYIGTSCAWRLMSSALQVTHTQKNIHPVAWCVFFTWKTKKNLSYWTNWEHCCVASSMKEIQLAKEHLTHR